MIEVKQLKKQNAVFIPTSWRNNKWQNIIIDIIIGTENKPKIWLQYLKNLNSCSNKFSTGTF